MAWVGSPAQSQMNLFLEYPFPRKSVVMSLKKNMAETVTHDMASSDWLKLAALCLFRALSVSGARLQSDRSTPLSNVVLTTRLNPEKS